MLIICWGPNGNPSDNTKYNSRINGCRLYFKGSSFFQLNWRSFRLSISLSFIHFWPNNFRKLQVFENYCLLQVGVTNWYPREARCNQTPIRLKIFGSACIPILTCACPPVRPGWGVVFRTQIVGNTIFYPHGVKQKSWYSLNFPK